MRCADELSLNYIDTLELLMLLGVFTHLDEYKDVYKQTGECLKLSLV
jgi:hypothetical protein